jgi:DeoR family transcriptional regulator, suf operon transcriptional repressor
MAQPIISPAGLRIIKLLAGNPPQTIAELLRAVGVTRTAIIEQLNELSAGGFVERQTQRLPGRGRPRYLYRATDAALVLLFASNEQLVVPAMWRAIRDVGGDDVLKKVVRRVSRLMAEHYNAKITSKRPEERLRQFLQLLAAEGGLIELSEADDGRVLFRKRTCAFLSMADSRRNVCHVDEEMMSYVVGRPVRRVCSRHDGAPCCTFEIEDE